MIYVSEWRSGEEMRRKLKSEALKTEFAVQIRAKAEQDVGW
jgi:hypothetical protein